MKHTTKSVSVSVLLALVAALTLLVALPSSAEASTPDLVPVCQEDDPCFDSYTMGNGQVGHTYFNWGRAVCGNWDSMVLCIVPTQARLGEISLVRLDGFMPDMAIRLSDGATVKVVISPSHT